ncbi:hypothetical protein C8Q74DRAFT_1222751 [Fomes fomentarius]|nr:hypothetical protein C8Q74DRAFT_1222751 [Fomes fomentarius]
MTEFHKTYYVVLGGESHGIKECCPAGISWGYDKLLPQIIITPSRKDAEKIYMLQEKIVGLVKPGDMHTLVYMLQEWVAGPLMLTYAHPMWAIRDGMDPGLYLGYDWWSISYNLKPPPKSKNYSPSWKKFDDGDIYNVLVWLFKRGNYNLPLSPAAARYPMPLNYKKLRFDLPENNDLEHKESPPPSLPSPSLPSPSPLPPPTEPVAATFYNPSAEKASSRAPSPVKLPRATTKVRARPFLPSDFDSDCNGTEPFPVFVPLTAPSLPANLSSRSTSPFKSSGAASSDVHMQRNRALASMATASVTAPEVVPGNLSDDNVLLVDLYFQANPMLAVLHQIVRMLMTMGSDSRYPAVNFGPYFDNLFVSNGYDARNILLLLQARVHANSVESFTHHVGLLLGWPTCDAAMLWNNMELPDISYLDL